MRVRVKEKSVILGESHPVDDIIDISVDLFRERGEHALEPLDPIPDGKGDPDDPGDPSPVPGNPDDTLVAGMNREETIRKLKEMGVNVHPNIGDEKLKERFLETVEGNK